MSEQALARLDQLSVSFSRLADRAPWVRAAFPLREGKFGTILFGRVEEVERDQNVSRGMGKGDVALTQGIEMEDLPVITELEALTEQAGVLFWSLLRSKSYRWEPACNGPFDLHPRTPRELWLCFLLRTPPVCITCWTKGTDDDKRTTLAFGLVGESNAPVTVWIDNYPHVCVGALALLTTRVLSNSNAVPQSVEQKQLLGKVVNQHAGPSNIENAVAALGRVTTIAASGKPVRIGRPRVGEGKIDRRDALKKNVYDRIQSEKKPRVGPKAILNLLTNDKQFQELVREAGLQFGKKLIRAALRQGQGKAGGHETRSRNIS